MALFLKKLATHGPLVVVQEISEWDQMAGSLEEVRPVWRI